MQTLSHWCSSLSLLCELNNCEVTCMALHLSRIGSGRRRVYQRQELNCSGWFLFTPVAWNTWLRLACHHKLLRILINTTKSLASLPFSVRHVWVSTHSKETYECFHDIVLITTKMKDWSKYYTTMTISATILLIGLIPGIIIYCPGTVFRRLILTSKVDPRTERIKNFIVAIVP